MSDPRSKPPSGAHPVPARRRPRVFPDSTATRPCDNPAVARAVPLARSAPTRGGATLPVAASALGIAIAVLALRADLLHPAGQSAAATALHVAGGLTYVGVGAAAWWRRPRNRTGVLMVAVGIAWFAQDLTHTTIPLAFALGDLLWVAYFGFLGHLVLAFPSGRLETPVDRVVVSLGYLWAVGGNLLTQVLVASPANSADIFAIHQSAAQYAVANSVQRVLDVTLCVIAVLLVAVHYARGTTPARRALAPAVWACGPMLLAALALTVPGLFVSAPWLDAAMPVITPIALTSLPIAFVLGLLRSRLNVAAVGHLVVELGSSPPPGRIRDAMAETLHDPSLALAYRVPGREGWVDAEGGQLGLPDSRSSRAFTVLERGGDRSRP